MLLLFLSFLSFFSVNTAPAHPQQATLILQIDNISKQSGMLWIGLYNSEESFLIKEKAILIGENVTQTGKMEIQIPDISHGAYAIAIFHDVNNNGEMDRNFLGIPSEPFSFIRKPKSKWRLPRFEEVVLEIYQPRQVFQVPLKKWWGY